MDIMEYDAWNLECKRPFGAVPAKTQIEFCIRTQRSNIVSQAWLMVKIDGGEPIDVEMSWTGINNSRDVFECKYTAGDAGLYFYWFEVETPDGRKYICRDAKGSGNVSIYKKDLFQLSVFDPSFKTPDWLKGGVMYQIFPDRFCRQGEFPKDLPSGRMLIDNWGEMPLQCDNGKYCNNAYFGGNFKGVLSKLPYLKSLGVTVIYFNPIFESHAYHRYHTANYMKIDPLLGETEDLKELCAEALKYGIKIIIDGVFSHTGADSIYFNREGRYPEIGAYQSENSKYSDWYDFENWPNKYRCWWGFIDLPEVKEESPDYLSFITGENGVADYWLGCGISGWRLDVADELPGEFIESLRDRVKKNSPDAVVIGEVWEDASNKVSYSERRRYLQGQQLDSVMNYPWRGAIFNYIKTGKTDGLSESIMTILENYPKQTVDVLMNLLDSHDTERLITGLVGESSSGRSVSWKQQTKLSKEQRELGVMRVKLASVIQYFLPGVPCLYYGDEVGAQGYEDPFNRECFPWGHEDTELLEWYQKLGEVRLMNPAVKQGGYRQIEESQGLFIFARTDENGVDVLICAVNAGNYNAKTSEQIAINGRLCLSCGGASIDDGRLHLPAKSCAVVGFDLSK